MPLYGPAFPGSNQFMRLWISTATTNPALGAALSLTYTEVKFVKKVSRGGKSYDMLEVSSNASSAKTHIKGMYQDEGISQLELIVASDAGQTILFGACDEGEGHRVLRYQPSGNFAGQREEYHYCLLHKFIADPGDIAAAIIATVDVQCCDVPLIRLIP